MNTRRRLFLGWMCLFFVILGICPLYASGDEIIIGTGTSTWEFPLFTYFHDARTQTIYLGSEIGDSYNITGLALDVTQLPSQTMNNFTIRMRHTDLSAYGSSPSWESSDWTIVYQTNQSISATGWVQFDFTTPFEYNGSQNLMVDISFNNNSWSSAGSCRYSVPGVNRTIVFWSDSQNGDPLTWSGGTPAPYPVGVITNIKLTVESSNKVSTPVFSPGGGPYDSSQNVTISCSTPGATIHYTTNGLDPNESDPVIASSSSVPVNQTLTLKARAWKDGLEPSNIKSANYQLIVATPVFSPGGSTYNYEPNVIITCSTSGSTIHYTITGLDPNESDQIISSGSIIVVSDSLTLKARAWKDGLEPSNVMSADYNIIPSVINEHLPWLHTDANKIKDPVGNVVVLRGLDTIDLGTLQQWRTGGVMGLIDRITNKSDSNSNSPGWYPNVIRLAVYPKDEGDTYSPWYFEDNPDSYYNNLLRPVVDYCKTKDLYAIIDWHFVGDHTYTTRADTNDFWEYIAPRFAGDSHVLFELFNEPDNTAGSTDVANWLTCRPDMQTWIDIVRTYAPDNLILVSGPSWSQQIGPAADYPLTGSNIVMVAHLYPGHWTGYYGDAEGYKNQVRHCLTRYPVFATEWGFRGSLTENLLGTVSNYGQPLMDFYESLKISNTAWVTDYSWQPEMFDSNWNLLVDPENEMGGFVKDTLYARRNDDKPVAGDPNAPEAPTGLSATGGEQMISLSWNDNTEEDLRGYYVYRSTTSGSDYIKLNSSYLTSSNYTDNTVSGYVTYYYVVTALDTSNNESYASNEAFAVATDVTPPSAPAGLTASGGNMMVSLDWNDNSEPDISGYNVYRSTTSGSGFVKINSSISSGSGYVDNSVINEHVYYYKVTSVDTSSNESGYSNEVSAEPETLAGVQILGSWVEGATHAKEAGTNRALLFFVYAEYATSGVSLNSVTYSGRTMTKVIDQYYAGTTDGIYVAAFMLNDTNIVAANSSGIFSPNWTDMPTGIAYSSVFFGNVDQATPVAANVAGTSATNPTVTAELATSSGDMVVLAITASTTGTFTINNGFTKAQEYGMTSSDGADGYKLATGVPETPNVTFSSTAARKVIIGLTIKAKVYVTGDGSGSVLSEWWTGIPGTAVSDLTSDVNYPDKPAGRELLTALEGPVNWSDNYGARIRGYLYPPSDGDYTFSLTSDADSQLWLSTDDTPANKALIASVSGSGSQQSSAISLLTGQKYYIEVLHKEGAGGDSITVFWEGPGITQQIIDGIYLSPAALKFVDYSGFAGQWQQTGCNAGNEWCYGFDFTRDGSVQIDDLEKFAESWLFGN